jgi:hypothetical protein
VSGRQEGLAAAMAAAYPDPRGSMARQIASGLAEARALFYLMAACGVLFVASVPNALRAARGLDADEPVSAALGAHLFGYLFLAPVLLYVSALLVHWIARGFGGRGTALATRAAVFWSLLLAAPVALAIALVGVVAEVAAGPAVLPWVGVLSYAGLALWLWIFAACLAEAERFENSGLVAAVIVAAFGGVAGLLAVLAGGAIASL